MHRIEPSWDEMLIRSAMISLVNPREGKWQTSEEKTEFCECVRSLWGTHLFAFQASYQLVEVCEHTCFKEPGTSLIKKHLLRIAWVAWSWSVRLASTDL
jgi:hypothetical protein